jgi:hypothetical protein
MDLPNVTVQVPAGFRVLRRNFIEDLRVVRGGLPPRVFGLVLEWAFRHRFDLGEAWKKAEDHKRLTRIPPLE